MGHGSLNNCKSDATNVCECQGKKMAADFFTLQNWELFPSLSYVQEITEKQQLVNETSIQQDLD